MQHMPSTGTSPPPAALSGVRILVADDDPGSRFFLTEALRGFGCEVSGCVDGPEAIDMASAEHFHLMLLDRRMPGAGAAEVLSRLRANPEASSQRSRAVATSAEVPPAIRAQLLAQGFAAVLEKPCDIARLRQVVLASLPENIMPPVLDDEAALACSGDTATMNALRVLLHDELVNLRDEFATLETRPKALDERLHRLRSACGFCGATRLLVRTRALQKAAADGADVAFAASIEHFRHVLNATIESLEPADVD
jgi:two-component system OmpR family response regulator